MASLPPKHSLSSPTAGNAHQPVLPTPSSSTSVSLRQINYRSLQLRKELELQLLEKQRLMQESSSGIGKNVLARQIAQLQERIKEIDNVTQHMDLQSTNSIERLKSLERDLTSYRSHPLSPGMSSIRNKEKVK
jgi:TolA-binding protein